MNSYYFKTSSRTLETLAKKGRFECVAGFLALARHAMGTSIGGFPPFSFTGAGINAIHVKGCMSEESARGVFEELKREEIISLPPSAAKQASKHVRWQINQGELDLALPHAFLDGLNEGTVTSAIKRIKKPSSNPRHPVEGLSNTEKALDALMLLVGVYKHAAMESFGGVSPHCVYRKWTLQSRVSSAKGYRWGADLSSDDGTTAYTSFMISSLAHLKDAQKDLTDRERNRFWNAFELLRGEGLVYEAVSLFDADPRENSTASLVCSLRINDYHASSIGDPSLLAELEAQSGAEFGFYTNAVNDRGEPEQMWVILPNKEGAIIGIWRPRFRAATPDVGAWVDKEKQNIADVLTRLSQAQGT
ncbi:hypothetical protein [Achromobacter kerstersii]|uniref:hypothetical protein n=1 Tax=Achromobacter kerstersii TaxID=1353890 RepID=UPI000A63A5D8|nr:hypothetical protein [Achromobacter kerstersii]